MHDIRHDMTSISASTSKNVPKESRVNGSDDHDRPRKRTRCLRSCLACRKAKQRCQLPDSFVEPSNLPLPGHLACRRCVVLEHDCLVIDSVPRASASTGRHRQDSRVTQPPLHQQTSLEPSQSWRSYDESLESIQQTSEQTSLSVPRSEGDTKEHEDEHRSLSCSGSTPPPVNDLRLFDPDAAREDMEESDIATLERQSGTPIQRSFTNPKAKKTRDWIKVGMTVCRPFELLGYLLRKQSISRHLFAQGSRPINLLMDLVIPTPDLRERYNIEADALQISMPFLPTFEEIWQAGTDADLLLGVTLYMSYMTRQEDELQSQILPVLRQHCLSCLLHQPRNVYDIISLLLVALHLPLLVGALSDGNCLDGAGLLTSAASASRSFDLNKSFSRLQSAASPEITSRQVRNACLWTSLSLYTGYVALAGEVERQPIVKSSSEDLDALQAYSVAASASSLTSTQVQRECAAISLLILRTRATNEIREMGNKYASLMKVHRDDIDRSSNIASFQSIFNESKEELQRYCDALKSQHHHQTATKLASFGWQKNYCVDVMGLDLALLQLLCLSRFTEKLFERSPNLIGHDSSPTDLLTLLHLDIPLRTLYSTVGCLRADIAKHVLALLMNTVRHACSIGKMNSSKANPVLLILSIPPTHLCSSLVMAGQAITEELDGRITDGQSPSKKIGDSTMEIAEILLHGTMQALMQLSETMQSPQSCAKKAAHQGDLFVLSARLVDSLTRRLVSWKGVAVLSNIHRSAVNDQTSTETEQGSHFDLDGFSPESFEDLFREILATPIEFL